MQFICASVGQLVQCLFSRLFDTFASGKLKIQGGKPFSFSWSKSPQLLWNSCKEFLNSLTLFVLYRIHVHSEAFFYLPFVVVGSWLYAIIWKLCPELAPVISCILIQVVTLTILKVSYDIVMHSIWNLCFWQIHRSCAIWLAKLALYWSTIYLYFTANKYHLRESCINIY